MSDKPTIPESEQAANTGVSVNCAFTEMAPVADLLHHPKNPNQHSEGQLLFIRKVLEHQGWRSPLTVSNRSGFVVCGNGRLMAARAMGLETVPVDRQDFASEDDEVAHILADNRLATLAEMDFELAAGLLGDLDGVGFDLDLTGFQDFEREPLLAADWSPPEVGDLDAPEDAAPANPIAVTKAQREIFERAVAKIRVTTDDPETSEGRCVELLAADYLAG